MVRLKKKFLFSKNFQTVSESTYTSIQFFSKFSGVKWQESDSDRSPTSTAEIHDDSSYTSTRPVRFNGLHRDKFT
jgi:hypothetical protein